MYRFRSLSSLVVVVVAVTALAVMPAAAETVVVDTSIVSVASVEGDGTSFNPAISGDGGIVVYQSWATNLVAGDGNDKSDIFVYDVGSGTTSRVSVATDGGEADRDSYFPAVSADGGKVVFQSAATNLVVGDTNARTDVFVHDLALGVTTRVSVATGGTQADNHSYNPAISADGSTIVYESLATNLVPGDSSGHTDVFAYDIPSGVTNRISVHSSGAEADDGSFNPAVSADGSTIVYQSSATNLVAGDSNGNTDVFAYDSDSGVTTRVSVASDGTQANNGSFTPAVAGDGSTVAYNSYASNLVPGDTNGNSDVFAHDIADGATTRISVATDGTQSNNVSSSATVSADGSAIVYESIASNLVNGDSNGTWDVFAHDIVSGVTTRISVDSLGVESNHESFDPAISGDGSTIVYESYASNLVDHDTNDQTDVFAYDVAQASTTRTSIASDTVGANEQSYDPAISADGSTIVFVSRASNLVADDSNESMDVFAYDVASGVTTRISVGVGGVEANDDSSAPVVTADGSTIVYNSGASNLVNNDSNGAFDVFSYDVASGVTTRISVGVGGVEANSYSYAPAVSADGSTIAYHSLASNLVAGDSNGYRDVFAYDVASGVTTRISVATDGTQGNYDSYVGAVSANGSTIVYSSGASNLAPGDTNGNSDVFAHDVASGVTTRISIRVGGVEANQRSSDPTMSANGSTIVYSSHASNLVAGDSNGFADVFAHDVASGVTSRISVVAGGVEANGGSGDAAISADGSTIVYSSYASNLVENDTTEGVWEVFAFDLASGVTSRISVGDGGVEANDESYYPAVSADGSAIVYSSHASNLVADDSNGYRDVYATRTNRSPRTSGFTTTVAEDVAVGTPVGTVTATDADTDPLSYTIIAGDPDGLFTIGTTSGTVSINKDLDYETATNHTLTVTVSDGSLTETATVTINVTDVYDPEPGYNPFDDDNGSIFENDIEWLALSGITQGCGTRLFCPYDNVTRGQMAAFLTRGLNLPPVTRDYFTDDDTSIFKDDINRLAQSGITTGCGSNKYCPNDYVTRGQMAAFLVRGLGYTDDGGGDLFTDDDESVFRFDIDKLATAGVTLGCNPPVNDQYCPGKAVTRAQMAAFLHRALG